MKNIKQLVSLISFVAAIIIGFIALFLPPSGVIDSSVLWFTAQLLVFTSGLLGVNMSVDNLNKIINSTKQNKRDST